MNEAETCRTLVRPKLEAAGWEANGERDYREQIAITDGRVFVASGKPKRLERKVPDFLLYFTRDVLLGVVEAKHDRRTALRLCKPNSTRCGRCSRRRRGNSTRCCRRC